MLKVFFTTAVFFVLSTASFAADSAAGKATYDKSCKSCHGADGAGNPAIAKMMKVDLKDLKAPDIKADDIEKAITQGKGKMKPIAGVSAADAANVAAYVKSLK